MLKKLTESDRVGSHSGSELLLTSSRSWCVPQWEKMGLLNGMGDGDSNTLQLYKKIGDFTFPDSRSFVSCKVKTKNNLRSQRTVTNDTRTTRGERPAFGRFSELSWALVSVNLTLRNFEISCCATLKLLSNLPVSISNC